MIIDHERKKRGWCEDKNKWKPTLDYERISLDETYPGEWENKYK